MKEIEATMLDVNDFSCRYRPTLERCIFHETSFLRSGECGFNVDSVPQQIFSGIIKNWLMITTNTSFNLYQQNVLVDNDTLATLPVRVSPREEATTFGVGRISPCFAKRFNGPCADRFHQIAPKGQPSSVKRLASWFPPSATTSDSAFSPGRQSRQNNGRIFAFSTESSRKTPHDFQFTGG